VIDRERLNIHFYKKTLSMDRVISQTTNGRVFICPNCEKIHIEFNNFLFSFNNDEFGYFKSCFERIDACYYEKMNTNIAYKRKIIVPIGHRNVSMMLNKKELKELQVLLTKRAEPKGQSFFLSTQEIGIAMGAN